MKRFSTLLSRSVKIASSLSFFLSFRIRIHNVAPSFFIGLFRSLKNFNVRLGGGTFAARFVDRPTELSEWVSRKSFQCACQEFLHSLVIIIFVLASFPPPLHILLHLLCFCLNACQKALPRSAQKSTYNSCSSPTNEATHAQNPSTQKLFPTARFAPAYSLMFGCMQVPPPLDIRTESVRYLPNFSYIPTYVKKNSRPSTLRLLFGPPKIVQFPECGKKGNSLKM